MIFTALEQGGFHVNCLCCLLYCLRILLLFLLTDSGGLHSNRPELLYFLANSVVMSTIWDAFFSSLTMLFSFSPHTRFKYILLLLISDSWEGRTQLHKLYDTTPTKHTKIFVISRINWLRMGFNKATCCYLVLVDVEIYRRLTLIFNIE